MKVTVEFLGLARRLAGCNQTQLDLAEPATLRDVVRALAMHYPSFLNQIIVPHTHNLISPYFFSIGGRFAATSLEAAVDSCEPLVLMFLEAGG